MSRSASDDHTPSDAGEARGAARLASLDRALAAAIESFVAPSALVALLRALESASEERDAGPEGPALRKAKGPAHRKA
jgi:hypothetical protein